MTNLTPVSFADTDLDAVAAHSGRVAVFIDAEGKLDPGARRVNRLTKGAIARVVESDDWGTKKDADIVSLAYPAGMAAHADAWRAAAEARGGHLWLCDARLCIRDA